MGLIQQDQPILQYITVRETKEEEKPGKAHRITSGMSQMDNHESYYYYNNYYHFTNVVKLSF